jgi:hypothetical protein
MISSSSNSTSSELKLPGFSPQANYID